MAITAEIDKMVQQAAIKYNVPVNLIRAVIAKESGQKQGGDPVANYWSANPNATSPKGAMGLMQLIPPTAKSLGVENAYDPAQNIEGGVKYLKQQLDAFGGDATKALAAYNAGPGAVQKYNGVPPYRETRNYVAKISDSYLPALNTAFAGSAKDPDTSEILSQPNALSQYSTKMSSTVGEAQAAGVGSDEAARIQDQYSAAGSALDESAQQQRQYAKSIADMAASAPDLAASATESLAATNAALANFSAGARAAVDRTFAELEQKDIARRAILQNMLTDKNLDPTVQGSIADMSTDNMAMINRRMNATILAEQATNEMSIVDNPAGFFEKMLFGNLYTAGRKELRSQFDDLKATTDGTLETVNSQAKQAQAAKIGDPELDKLQMEAALKLAEIDKDVAIQQAQAPLKIAEAQIQAMQLQAQMMGYGVDAMKSAANTQVQANEANIKAIEAPGERAMREAQIISASNAAASSKMDLYQQRRFYEANNALLEIELNGKTAEAKKQAAEARAALNAAQVLDAAGKLDEAALERALTESLKAASDFAGAAASVSSGSSVKQVEAQNAQFQQTIEAKPNPKYEALKEEYDIKRMEAGIEEIRANEGTQRAVDAGKAALGLPPTVDLAKYPPEVQNAVILAGQGIKAGVNSVAAAQALSTGGIASKSPELALTAQAVLKMGVPDADGKIVPFSTLKPEEVDALSQTSINAAVNMQEENKTKSTPIFSTDYVYGMLPPAILENSPHLTAQQQVSLSKFKEVVAANTAAATSIESMIRGLAAADIPADKIPRIVADIATASMNHNNATRKYNLLGLQEQSGVHINNDPLGYNWGKKTELDMTDEADVQMLIMDMRARGNLGKPVLHMFMPVIPNL